MDTEEFEAKVDKVLELVGTDITHRVISEWLNKASASARQKFGDALLARIPEVAYAVVNSKLRQFAEGLADDMLRALRPRIEAQVRAELEKQAEPIAVLIAERVKQRAPQVAEGHMSELIRKAARG